MEFPGPTPFAHSLRALEADGFKRPLWGLLLLLFTGSAAAGWFFFARVAVYEISRQARLEATRAVHPVEAPVAGRVVGTHLVLGRTVPAGDLLVELESENEQLQLKEEKTRLETFRRRLEALREQITAEAQAWPEEQKASVLGVTEARARQREAEATAQFAEGEADRSRQLSASKLVAQSELQRAEAEAQKYRAAAPASAVTVSKLEADVNAKEKNHAARLAQLKRDAVLLEGEIATGAATVQRGEYEVGRRRVRAAVAGRLGEVAELQIGGFVTEGQKLAAIVPAGEVLAVAHFAPATGLGRLRSGQTARVRLDGFAWSQYGTLAATVARVANEPRDSQIRVELTIHTNSASLIPLQHGLSGTVEVQVERVTPAVLVLRAAGKLVSARAEVKGAE